MTLLPIRPLASPAVARVFGRMAVVASASVVAAAVMGCVSQREGQLPGAKSPEAQSDAEYDVARDVFFKGQPRAALDHARKAISLNEENSRALYFAAAIHLSFCATELGARTPDCTLQDAESFARRAVAADSTFRDARNLLGNVLILEGKNKEAVEVLTPLTKDPAYTETHLAWGNLGWAQVQLGRLDEGIASLQNAVTQPRFCVGFYRLGVAYEKKGNFKEADAHFSSALSVDSPECKNLQDAWKDRARVRAKLGLSAEARADLERCREISTVSEAGRECVRALGTGSSTSMPPGQSPAVSPSGQAEPRRPEAGP